MFVLSGDPSAAPVNSRWLGRAVLCIYTFVIILIEQNTQSHCFVIILISWDIDLSTRVELPPPPMLLITSCQKFPSDIKVSAGMVAVLQEGVRDLGCLIVLSYLRLGFHFMVPGCCDSCHHFHISAKRKKKRLGSPFCLRPFCGSCMCHFCSHPNGQNLVI